MTTPPKPVPDNGGDDLKRNPLKCASKIARAGADYAHSLRLLAEVKAAHPQIPSKSGLMVGLGESNDELAAAMRDLRAQGCELLTIGQYLAVERYVHPDEFDAFARIGRALGFRHVASGPLVRSSCHAGRQAHSL